MRPEEFFSPQTGSVRVAARNADGRAGAVRLDVRVVARPVGAAAEAIDRARTGARAANVRPFPSHVAVKLDRQRGSGCGLDGHVHAVVHSL